MSTIKLDILFSKYIEFHPNRDLRNFDCETYEYAEAITNFAREALLLKHKPYEILFFVEGLYSDELTTSELYPVLYGMLDGVLEVMMKGGLNE